MQFRFPIPVLLAGFLLAPAAAAQTTRTLPAEADTHLRDLFPGVNYGNSQDLWLGKATNQGLGVARTLIRFDTQGILLPPKRLRRATLSLYQHATEAGPGGINADVHMALATWQEPGVSWSNQPAMGSRCWSTAIVGDPAAIGWVEWDLTELVRNHLSGLVPNMGWFLRARDEQAGPSRQGYFHSREYVTDPSLRPRLTIEIYELVLAVSSPVAGGQPVTLTVSGATTNDLVYYLLSRKGPGETPVPPLGVTLDLRDPILIGSVRPTGGTTAGLTRTVPAAASGLRVWVQAAQKHKTSNLEQIDIQ